MQPVRLACSLLQHPPGESGLYSIIVVHASTADNERYQQELSLHLPPIITVSHLLPPQ